MRMDIMTDIETLGHKTDSTIIQIAAIAFDIQTGEIYHRFNKIADIEKNGDSINVTGSTLKWWMNTNPDLFAKLLMSGEMSSQELLKYFYDWIRVLKQSHDLYLWGNGILFDNKMIQHQMESNGLTYPIFYRNDRDLRTLVELASEKLGISERELKERFNDDSLTAHNAYDDVLYQINVAVECHKILTGSE